MKPDPKSVLILYRGGTAGILPACSNQAKHLAGLGYDVTLFTLGDPDTGRAHEEIENVRVLRPSLWSRNLPKNGAGWAVKYVEFLFRAFLEAVLGRAKLIVAIDVETVPAGWLACLFRNKRLVYHAFELYAERPGVPYPELWRALDRFFATRVDATLSCQEDRTEFMKTEYGARDPILTIRNVPIYNPTASDHQGEMKRRLEALGVRAEFVALYQGRLTPDRCVFEIIEAARHLDEGVAIAFVGPMTDEVRAQFGEIVSRHDLGGRVAYLGYVRHDELPRLTASSDLGLVFQKNVGANSFHAAPVKLYQYLAAGLPVVGSNFPSLVSVLEDEKRPVGFGADPENSEAIAGAINAAFADTERLERFRDNALWLAENEYRYDLEVEPMVELYERLLRS